MMSLCLIAAFSFAPQAFERRFCEASPRVPHAPASAMRLRPPCACVSSPPEVSQAIWSTTDELGFKFIDDEVGQGEAPTLGQVVQLHYTVTVLSSGTVLGTSRTKAWPLTFALGRHNVPIFDEALQGMRIGGRRRLLVPPSAIPESQASNVPGSDQ